MRWVTRKNAAVDRIACPWLIRRFIDPEAEFLVRRIRRGRPCCAGPGRGAVRCRGSQARARWWAM